MNHKGKMMEFWGILMDPQVKALDDYIHGRPCTQPGSCVVTGSEQWAPKQ